MKRFLTNVIILAAIAAFVFAAVIAVKTIVARNVSLRLPEQKHVVFAGASHIQHGIDDTLLDEGVNMASSSERYMFTYLKLRRLFDENPQIDTVFLQVGPTDLWQHTDDKYFALNEMSFFIPAYFPWFGEEEWDIYRPQMRDVATLIAQKSFSPDNFRPSQIRLNLGHGTPKEENLGIMDSTKVQASRIDGSHGHGINHRYLRKIMELCGERGVKLYGLYMPMWHQELYYDTDYYRQVLAEKFSDLDLLDYSDMALADSCRLDPNHLNWHGAQVMTGELKERFGLK